MLVWVEVNLVGWKSSDHEPSLCNNAVPRWVEPAALRSPKIHTSTTSIPPAPATGSAAVPLMVNVAPPLADTFWFSSGLPIVSFGGPLATDGAAGAGAGGGAAGGAGAATGGAAGG